MKKKKWLCLVICFSFIMQFFQPVSVQAGETGTEEIQSTETEMDMEEVQSTEMETDIEDVQGTETEESTENVQGMETEAGTEDISLLSDTASYTYTDENGNQLVYRLDENSQAVIYQITLSGADLTIPADLEGYVVASVENENTCAVANPEVSIPNLMVSCASVGANALSGLSIGTLTLTDGISSFGGYINTASSHVWKQFGDCTIGNVVYEAAEIEVVIPQELTYQPTIIGIFGGSTIGTITFGENVQSIAPFLFYGAMMQVDELSIAVPKIGAKAFGGENIKIGNLILEETVTTLGESPYSTTANHYYQQFSESQIDNVTLNATDLELEHEKTTAASVNLYGPFSETEIGAINISENVTKIAELMFADSILSIDELELHVKEIGAFAFSGTDISIGTLTIGNEVETFAESYFSTNTNHRYNQFRYTDIGKVVYQAVNAEISHVSANSSVDYIYGMFYQAEIGDLVIGEEVESIPEYLFDSATMELESLVVNAREIGANAFSGASIDIGTLTIGSNVQLFEESYFSTTSSHYYKQFAASNIGTVYYNATAAELSHVTSVAVTNSIYGMFQKSEIGEVYIGDDVEVIPEYLFDSAIMSLESLNVNVKEVGASAFAGASISIGTLTIGPKVEVFAESYFSTTSLHYYKQFAAVTITNLNYEAVAADLSHTASNGATGGVYGMFWKAEIGDVTIADEVEVIPEYLFDTAEITLDELYLNVKEVGANAFYGSNISIGTLTLGENVEEFSESYFSTTSTHKYFQFGYTDIGTVNFLSKSLVLSNDTASISTTSTINGPFKSCAIGTLYISENVTSIPNYIFKDAEITLDKLTINAESVGTYAFYSSYITIGELTIGEKVSEFLTDVSGKSFAFGYNEITTLNYNAASAGMDSPKTGIYGPFRYAEIENLNVGEKVAFIDNCFFRGNTFTNSNVSTIAGNDDYKAQSLTKSYAPASTNLSIHANSDFATYFSYDAENTVLMCENYWVEDGYGDVIYDEETGTYNIEVKKHCSVCGYETTELEAADMTYEIYLSIPLGITLNLDVNSMAYTGSESIYAYGILGNAYEGLCISIDSAAESYGTAQKGEETIDISEIFSSQISGDMSYAITSAILAQNKNLVDANNLEEINKGELAVSVEALELLKNGIGTYEISVPIVIELDIAVKEETE